MRPARLTRARYGSVLGACAALCLISIALAPLFGSSDLDLRKALDPTLPLSQNLPARLILYSRLPRVLSAAVAGAGLALSGVVFQALLRNPLASPYTLGVASGGSLGAVLAIRLGLETLSLFGVVFGTVSVPLFAFLGALATVWLVWQLGARADAGPVTLLLAGVTLAFIESALMMAILYTADFSQTYRIVRWQMGDLDVMRYDLVLRMAAPVGVAFLVILPRSRALNALSQGEDAAAGLGIDVAATTKWCYLSASLLVGAVVSVVGPIGFVGLVVPHTLRALIGPDHRLLLPASAFMGSTFLILCDLIAQLLLRPAVLPVGVVTACIGGPFFLALLYSKDLRGRLWS